MTFRNRCNWFRSSLGVRSTIDRPHDQERKEYGNPNYKPNHLPSLQKNDFESPVNRRCGKRNREWIAKYHLRLWRKNHFLGNYRPTERTKNDQPEIPKLVPVFVSESDLDRTPESGPACEQSLPARGLLSSLLQQMAHAPDVPLVIPLNRWPAESQEQRVLEDL